MNTNELFQLSKSLEKTCGIYSIYCSANEFYYVGQSKNISRRWYEHLGKLRVGRHVNDILQRVYNKYGKESLQLIILENCSKELLGKGEEYWVSKFNPEKLMNLGKVGESFDMTEETKRKIGDASKKRVYKPLTLEQRENLRQKNLGKKCPEEVAKKISESNKGKKRSPESIIKIKAASKKRGISQETLQKMAESRRRNFKLRSEANNTDDTKLSNYYSLSTDENE